MESGSVVCEVVPDGLAALGSDAVCITNLDFEARRNNHLLRDTRLLADNWFGSGINVHLTDIGRKLERGEEPGEREAAALAKLLHLVCGMFVEETGREISARGLPESIRGAFVPEDAGMTGVAEMSEGMRNTLMKSMQEARKPYSFATGMGRLQDPWSRTLRRIRGQHRLRMLAWKLPDGPWEATAVPASSNDALISWVRGKEEEGRPMLLSASFSAEKSGILARVMDFGRNGEAAGGRGWITGQELLALYDLSGGALECEASACWIGGHYVENSVKRRSSTHLSIASEIYDEATWLSLVRGVRNEWRVDPWAVWMEAYDRIESRKLAFAVASSLLDAGIEACVSSYGRGRVNLLFDGRMDGWQADEATLNLALEHGLACGWLNAPGGSFDDALEQILSEPQELLAARPHLPFIAASIACSDELTDQLM